MRVRSQEFDPDPIIAAVRRGETMLSREGWSANNLCSDPSALPADKAWSTKVSVDEITPTTCSVTKQRPTTSPTSARLNQESGIIGGPSSMPIFWIVCEILRKAIAICPTKWSGFGARPTRTLPTAPRITRFRGPVERRSVSSMETCTHSRVRIRCRLRIFLSQCLMRWILR